MKKTLLIIAALLTLSGCRTAKKLLPSVSGKAGEVVVVMEREDWENAPGREIRNLLAADCPYLFQKEALYSIINVAPGGFSDLLKVHRNIVFFDITQEADSASLSFHRDIWASPQCVIEIKAGSHAGAAALVQSDGERIVNAIEQAERDRVIANSIKYEERSIAPQIKEIFGGSPHFPSGFKLRKKTDGFAWCADDKQYVYQDILIYSYPASEDAFSMESLVEKRNEILKNNVPGMFEGSYMTTADFFEPQLGFVSYKGRTFAQLRGMWEVKNDFMGGPFVSHSFYSRDGRSIITLEAFIYAPKYDKRQYLRQAESILYSWEWDEEKEK